MNHQKVFSTHIFIKDNYLAPQRFPAMQEEIKNLYKQTSNFQTGPNLDKTEPFKWFANDIGKTAFDIIDKLNYNVEQIEITGMWGNILQPGETHPPHTHSNNFLSGVFYLESDAETWQINATHFSGSWWPVWEKWIESFSGEKVKARKEGSKSYPSLSDAPGTYVLQKS